MKKRLKIKREERIPSEKKGDWICRTNSEERRATGQRVSTDCSGWETAGSNSSSKGTKNRSWDLCGSGVSSGRDDLPGSVLCWMIFVGQKKYISPEGTQICGRGSTVWLHWYSGSSIWIRSAIRCFCSAAAGGIGSRGLLGGRRICAGDKAAGNRKLPVATKQHGGAAADQATVPVVDGGTADRPAKGAERGSWSVCGLEARNWINNIRNTLKTLVFQGVSRYN